MKIQPRLLVALTLSLAMGCAERQPAPAAPNEPGTAAQAPPAEPPPSEPGSGGTPGPQEAEPQEGTTVYEVRLSGVRCITHPCPSHTATPVSPPGAEPVQVHELELTALNLSEERLEALNRQMMEGSARLEATLERRPDAGPAGAATVLRVTRWVEGPQ